MYIKPEKTKDGIEYAVYNNGNWMGNYKTIEAAEEYIQSVRESWLYK